MNILFCADSYPFKGNNYSSFISVLCEEIARKGHNIIVIAPQSITKCVVRGQKFAPKYEKITKEDGIIEVYRPFSLTFGDGRLGRATLKFNQYVTTRKVLCLKKHIDVCYAHFWKSAYNIVKWASTHGKPLFVATGEDVFDIQNYIKGEEIAELRDSTCGVICVSSKNKRESIALGLAKEDRCIVLPNAVNPKEFFRMDKWECRKKKGYGKNDFIVAFCGRFIQRKGVMRVSEAIQKLHDQTVKAIFIGSNNQCEKKRPDCDGILFIGTLPHSELVDYLNCADIFVLPTLAEGCSNSIVEAMACGLPIISSDLPFNYDILDETNSILVNPTSIDEIANAIKEVKNNLDKRIQLSQGAAKKASKLTIENRSTMILEFMSEMQARIFPAHAEVAGYPAKC